MASPCAGVPELKYGDVNSETLSPGEVKGLIYFLLNCYIMMINILCIAIESKNLKSKDLAFYEIELKRLIC